MLPAVLDHSLRNWSLYSLHHSKMLPIVVSLLGTAVVSEINVILCSACSNYKYRHKCDLEQREALVVLKQDAADTPDITGVSPAQLCGRMDGSNVGKQTGLTAPGCSPV